jgi:hypothetical protein
MKKILGTLSLTLTLTLALSLTPMAAQATDYSYAEIAKRSGDQKLDKKALQNIKMQAECLVGIKKLNFKRKDNFDPISEWTSFRTRSLLEQYSPCETLVMLEIAQKRLREEQANN